MKETKAGGAVALPTAGDAGAKVGRREFLGGGAALFLAGCRTARWFGRPELTFGVVSDIHVTTPRSTRLLRKALAWFRGRGADAVMIPGDLTDWGLRSGYRYVAEAWKDVMDGTGTVPLFCTGNHDFDGWRYADMTMEMHANGYSEDDHITNFGQGKVWEDIFGEPYAPVRVRTVKGYDFVSAEWRGYDALPAWMKANGARFRGQKPFFIFQHPPMTGTTSDSFDWADNGTGYEALKDFPNAVAFTGHTHVPFCDEHSFWQGAFTAFAVPSLSYSCVPSVYENATGGTSQTMPPIETRRDLRGGEGYFVSVYADKMVVERIDFDEDGEAGAPAWVVPLGACSPADPAYRTLASEAPRFPAGATVDVETRNARNRKGGWAIVMNCEFPAAVAAAGDRVLRYDIRAVPADGSEGGVWKFLNPAYARHPKHDPKDLRFWFDVRGLLQDRDYVLEAVAYNAFGKPSAPIRSRALRGVAGLERVKRTCTTLTFDDGLKGHLTVAAPILEKYGFTGCFNIVTGEVGKPGRLTWDDIRELKRRGHEIASHTVTHPNLVTLLKEKGAAAVRDEIVKSRDAIANALGEEPTLLCHPYVARSAEVDAIVRDCGLRPFCGDRYNTGSDMTPKAFAERLDGWSGSRLRNADVLFHGVSAETGGYSPVRTAADFEAMVRALRERKDRDNVEVVAYGTYQRWYGER